MSIMSSAEKRSYSGTDDLAIGRLSLARQAVMKRCRIVCAMGGKGDK